MRKLAESSAASFAGRWGFDRAEAVVTPRGFAWQRALWGLVVEAVTVAAVTALIGATSQLHPDLLASRNPENPR